MRSVHCVNRFGLVSDGCQSQKPTSLAACNVEKCTTTGIVLAAVSDAEERCMPIHTAGLHRTHLWSANTGKKETLIADNAPMKTSVTVSTNQLHPGKQISAVLLDWTVSDWSEVSSAY